MTDKNLENTGIVVNNEGIMREKATGRFVKGTKVPKNSGRPKGTGFQQRLAELVGEDSRDIAQVLAEIAFDLEHKDKNGKKRRYPKWTTDQRIKAIELILKYKEKLPSQDINANVEMKSINVSISAPTDINIDEL